MFINIKNFNNSGNDIHLEIKDKIVCLYGHSGSGKSSILHMIHGLRNYQGECDVQDSIYLPQTFRLLDHLSIEENVFLNMPVDRPLMEHYLNLYNITPTLSVSSMSGGERQRICFIRSIVRPTRVLLLDEPTSALDPHNTNITAEILRSIQNNYDHIVVSTHDVSFAHKISKTHIQFNNNNVISSV